MELIVNTDGTDTMKFTAEWDANLTLVIKRRGDAAFDTTLAGFGTMVDLIGGWLKSVQALDARIRS